MVINFPDPAAKSDVVQLRGPKNEVEKCGKFLQRLIAELVGWDARTHARTHTHTDTRTRTHMYRTNAHIYVYTLIAELVGLDARTHTPTHRHARTHAHVNIRACTHARTHSIIP